MFSFLLRKHHFSTFLFLLFIRPFAFSIPMNGRSELVRVTNSKSTWDFLDQNWTVVHVVDGFIAIVKSVETWLGFLAPQGDLSRLLAIVQAMRPPAFRVSNTLGPPF